MSLSIRELRNQTGLTQQAFADLFGIPVSTLRKWEQGESSPPKYVIRLLTRALPQNNQILQKIQGESGSIFFYNKEKHSVIDQKGNEILIQEELEGVKPSNLILYLEDLFDDFYQIQSKFNRDCRFDKQESIIWRR
ncbi:MAG: helix-turn-helix domain-containing protein [Clostridia bacterium]|nr:helix-turn-helix domain-containing protein [Clostridia bacterium]